MIFLSLWQAIDSRSTVRHATYFLTFLSSCFLLCYVNLIAIACHRKIKVVGALCKCVRSPKYRFTNFKIFRIFISIYFARIFGKRSLASDVIKQSQARRGTRILESRPRNYIPYGCCLVCRGCGCQSYTYLN